MQRLSGLMRGGSEEHEGKAWRAVSCSAAAAAAAAAAGAGTHTIQVRKIHIHLKSTHCAVFSRQFVESKMVDAVLNLLKKESDDEVVETGIWCLSELILFDFGMVGQVCWVFCVASLRS